MEREETLGNVVGGGGIVGMNGISPYQLLKMSNPQKQQHITQQENLWADVDQAQNWTKNLETNEMLSLFTW